MQRTIRTIRRATLRHGLATALAAACASLRPAFGQMPAPPVDDSARERRSRDWFTDTVLVDQHHRRHRFWSDLLAPPGIVRVVLLHPLFTSCSSACPLIVQRLLALRAELDESRRHELTILSLSVDPLTDTPEQLQAFALRHGVTVDNWFLLGGAQADIERVTRRLGLWTDNPEEHATTLIAGRPQRAHWTRLRPDADARALARQLDRFW